MNRTQYEAIHGSQIRQPCKACEHIRERQAKGRLLRKKKQAEIARARKAAVASGKVIEVWHRDDFTGWHYIDYKGRQGYTGCPEYSV